MGSNEAIISEEEFLALLERRAEPFLRFLALLLSKSPSDWYKRHYAKLVAEAHDLETFLDDYGAAHNRRFAQLREWVACLRGLGKTAASLQHLVSRMPRYQVSLDGEEIGEFFPQTKRTSRFLERSIWALARRVRAEVEQLGLQVPEEPLAEANVPDNGPRRQLPHDIDAGEASDERRRVVEVASMYLDAVGELEWLGEIDARDRDERRSLVIQKVDEERSRYYESVVHSLQSKYDTWITGTKSEREWPDLRYLRGHASVSLHLLEMATELVHFYVRHENDVREESVRHEVAKTVDKEEVLDRALHYAFRFGGRILAAGRRWAEEAIERFAAVGELRITLRSGQALHARPISYIVRIARHHGTRVEMSIGGRTCPANSIMEMILLAGNAPDAREIVFRGERKALDDIGLLFENGLGDGGELPEQLAYLREGG